MTSQQSDEQLLALYQQADTAAFNEFFRRYRHIIYNYLLAMLKNKQDADDAVQETFIKIHRSIHHYDPEKKALPWLFTMTRHIAYDFFKRRKKLGEVALSLELTHGTDESLALEARESLTLLLKDFSEDDRNLIAARFLEDGSFATLAAQHGLEAAALRKRLSRLVMRLKAKKDSC